MKRKREKDFSVSKLWTKIEQIQAFFLSKVNPITLDTLWKLEKILLTTKIHLG